MASQRMLEYRTGGYLGGIVVVILCVCIGLSLKNTERMSTELSMMEADYQTTLEGLNAV